MINPEVKQNEEEMETDILWYLRDGDDVRMHCNGSGYINRKEY